MRRVFMVALILMIVGTAGAQGPALTTHTMTVDGLERTYSLYVPDHLADGPAPLVMALHGFGGSGARMAALTNLSAVADDEGFVAVYPDGLNGEWKYFGGLLADPSLNTPDDVAFLNAVVDDVAARAEIDMARLYLIGYSNGGFMTYRMACHAEPNRFAAYGVAAGLIYPEMELPCLAAPVKPIVIEHGTADVNVAWDGIRHQPVRGVTVASRSALGTASFFAGRNGCATFGAERTDTPSTDGVTNISRFDFAECTTGQPVRFIAVIDGGHTWPGVAGLPVELAGPTNMDIDLGREMWAFFEQFSLPPTPAS